MRISLILLLIIVGLSSCVQHSDEAEKVVPLEDYEPPGMYSVKYAEGFHFEEGKHGFKIVTHSHSSNEEWSDEIVGVYTEDHDYPKDSKFFSSDMERLCCQSSTHLAFIYHLNEFSRVNGICGLEYVQNEDLRRGLVNNNAAELCIGDKTQAETILAQDPDLYFVYPFESENVADLEAQGVKTFMIAEYLETHPIARLEWIKVFGAIFNKYEEANDYFENADTEYFLNSKSEGDPNDKFFMNLPFGDSWNSPSSNSLIVQLCKDAGLTYVFDDEEGTENVIRSKEEMWQIGAQVPYWIIIASRPLGFDMEDLLEEEEVYKTFRSVKEGKVIFCNTYSSDYFTFGLLEPHIMMKELSRIVDGTPLARSKYFHLLN